MGKITTPVLSSFNVFYFRYFLQTLTARLKHRLCPFSKTLARHFSIVLCLLVNAVSIKAAQVCKFVLEEANKKKTKWRTIPLSIVKHQLTFNDLVSVEMEGRKKKIQLDWCAPQMLHTNSR